jgi:hypothetical protein
MSGPEVSRADVDYYPENKLRYRAAFTERHRVFAGLAIRAVPATRAAPWKNWNLGEENSQTPEEQRAMAMSSTSPPIS